MYTIERKIQCVEREIKKRKQVYPRLRHAMRPGEAEEEIAVMQDVLETLRDVQRQQQGQTALWPEEG